MPHTTLQTLTADPAPRQALGALVAAYDAELSARRSHLLDDLAIYRDKLRDLERLDPLDFTGLQELYRAHARHIEQLLTEFDGTGHHPSSASSSTP